MKKKIKKSLSIPLVLLVITGGVNPSYTLANGTINYSPKDPNNKNEVANLNRIKQLYPDGFKYGNKIQWVKGVKAPDASNFKIINEYTFADTPYAFYTVTDENANAGNWYDINKKFYGASDQNLCYAAVSGNMLHWWLNVNRDYVNRFLSIYPENDKRVYLDKEVTKLHNYLDSYKNQEESKIFEDFTKYFRFKNHGGWTDAINDFFINGYKPNYSSYENSERNWDENNLDPRGGYFSKVFGSEILSTRNMANNKYSFSNLLKQYLDEGKAVGVAYRIGKNVGPYHIISLWGAEFDNDGYVTAIYVTDSDDGKSKYEAIDDSKQIKKALFRYRVTYDKDNVPRISETTEPDNDRGGYVSYLYGLKTGKDTWEKFFKQADVMQKEEALKEAKKSLENLINDAKSTDIEKISDAIKKAEDKTKEPRATEQDFKEAKKELEKALEEYKKSKEYETNKVETGKITGEENSSSRAEDKTPIEEGETEQPQSGDSIAGDKKEDNQSDTPSSTEKEAKEENKQPEADKNNVEENTSREDASSNEPSTITEEGRSESENKAEEPKLVPEKDSKTESEPKVETEEKSETSEDKKEPEVSEETDKKEEKPSVPKANVSEPKVETKVEETAETTKPWVEPKKETKPRENELTRSIVAQVGDSKVEVLIKDENNEKYNVQVKDVTEQYKEAVLSKISEKVNSIKIFDIDLLDESKENIVKTDKDRTVRISLVENLENKTVNIYYVDDKTGELTLIPSKVKNNTVVFSVNHFSKYAVAVSGNKQQQKLPNTGGLDNSTSSLGLITIMITLGLVSRRNKVK